MRRNYLFTLCLMTMTLILLASASLGQEATEEPVDETSAEVTEEPVAEEETPEIDDATTSTYTVQPGDNLYRIALRFGTTANELAALNGITNSRLIFVGQVLRVPRSIEDMDEDTTQPSPQPTDSPTSPTIEYTVQPGDNLYRIAIRNNTTVAELAALNGLTNTNIVYVGQVLKIPGDTSDENTTQPTDGEGDEVQEITDTTTVIDETSSVEVAADFGFAFGITAFADGQNTAQIVTMVDDLGVTWVNIPVDWARLEAVQGELDFSTLRSMVDALDAAGMNIMLTISNAPAWSRSVTGDIIENGPPDDLGIFEAFISELVGEFTGKVDAYQVWEEPNLRRNWRCSLDDGSAGMCDTDYMEMLRIAYKAIKASDGNALVVTSGLAPTRFNDRVNAIDDRVYLQTLVAKNVTEISDAIGVHPGGFANPPDATCCEPAVGVESHYQDPSFYFLQNLQGYRQILVDGGAGDLPLWITRFGWGSSEDTSPPSEVNAYFRYVTLSQQAIYNPRAFALGQELGYVGAMFLDNLNGCVIGASRAEICYTSLIGPDGELRPVYEAVKDMNIQSGDNG